MSNLFENAYFGKPYRTKSEDRKALFSRFATDGKETWAILYLDRSYAEIWCTLDGRYFDWVGDKQKFWYDTPYIVSEWHEDIDVEKLDKLAKEYIKDKKEPAMRLASFNGFRAGYRKAKSE